jgi:hypothetical protein
MKTSYYPPRPVPPRKKPDSGLTETEKLYLEMLKKYPPEGTNK